MTGALASMRVLELAGGMSSAFGARVLGDFGAQVTVVDRAGASLIEPTDGGTEAAVLREYLNWEKQHVAVDADSGPARLDALIAEADIVVLGDDLATIRSWGIDPVKLAESRADLTVVTVTPYGLTGPMAEWSATELVLQALSGLLTISGTQDREPLMRGLRQSVYAAGLNAAYTAIASHYAVLTGREGALVDVARRDVLTSELVLNTPYYTFMGAVQQRLSLSKDIFFTGAPMPARDGMVTMQINNRIGVESFAEVFEDARFADPKYGTAAGRLRYADELAELVTDHLRRWQARDFFQSVAGRGMLAGFVQPASQLLTCPQLESRDVWRDVDVDGQRFRLPARLVATTPNSVLARSEALA